MSLYSLESKVIDYSKGKSEQRKSKSAGGNGNWSLANDLWLIKKGSYSKPSQLETKRERAKGKAR